MLQPDATVARLWLGEDQAAVADVVAIDHRLAHRHAHHRAAGLAAEQLDLHEFAGRPVRFEHRLPDLCGQFARIHRHAYSPLNRGARFSRNAVTPSM